jgi:hypothetical protein
VTPSRRRRLRFAAPLVIVTACGQAPPGALPVDPAPELGIAAVSPVDAAPPLPPIDAAVDAGVARPGTVAVYTPDRRIQDPGFVSCHDFGPGNRGCNPPRPRHEPGRLVHLDIGSIDRGLDSLEVTVLVPKGVEARSYDVIEPRVRFGRRPFPPTGRRIVRLALPPELDDATIEAGRVTLRLYE